MTFLEYVARRLIGPPAYGTMWRCPFHDDHHPSFSIRPPKPGYRVRFKCFGCGEWGDEADLVKRFYPREDYRQRLDRLAQYHVEYEREAQPEPVDISPGDSGSTEGTALIWRMLRCGPLDHADLLEVIGELNHQRNLRLERELLGRKQSKQLPYAPARRHQPKSGLSKRAEARRRLG